MSRQLTRMLLAGSLLTSSSLVLADAQLNRCLATNSGKDNRYEICYGQMHDRAITKSKSERQARVEKIQKQLEAEQKAAKDQGAQPDQPAKPTVTKPATTKPSPQPTKATTTPAIQTSQPKNNSQPNIFDRTSKPSKDQPRIVPRDAATPILPSDDSKKAKPGSSGDKSYPIQYY